MSSAFLVLPTLLLYTTTGLLWSKNDISSFLIKTFEYDSQISQITWLTNSTNEFYDLSAVATKVPSIVINYQNTTENPALELITMPTFIDSRSTLIVILSATIFPANNFQLLNFLTQLIQIEQRPKVLMIQKVTVGKSYRKFLKFMWMNKFLDLTILEIIPRKSGNEYFISDLLADSIVQHYFNPFTGRFTELRIKSKISFEVFPDKLMNLYGYKMKVGYFHFPPYVSITRNKSGHVLELDGPDYQLVKILSKAMNFRVLEVVSNKTGWDVRSCVKEENNGFLRDLMFNQLNFIGVQSGKLESVCSKKWTMVIDHSFGKLYYSAVTPTIIGDDGKISVELRLSYLMTTVYLLGITWLFPIFLHFEEHNWRIVDLIRIMLGMHAPPLPRQLSERIFFAFTLITCFLNSSVIFTAFTSINLQMESNTVINTLNDLYSSNFTPVIYSNVLKLFPLDDVKVADYVRRASKVVNTDSECIDYLLKHRNVTCFMRSTQVDLAISSAGKDHIPVLMHRVEEYLADLMICLLCEPGFPYATKFRKIFTRLQQTGIPYTWEGKYFNSNGDKSTMTDVLNFENDASNLQVLQNVLTILIIGFCFAIVAFVGELISHFCSRTNRRS